MAIFNQNWYKALLGEAGSCLNYGSFPKIDILRIYITCNENLQNNLASINQNWHKASFGKADSSL